MSLILTNCTIVQCTIFDDAVYLSSYVYLVISFLFLTFVLYSSVKYKTRLEYALRVSSAAAIVKSTSAESACFIAQGCRFLTHYSKADTFISLLTCLFQFLVFVIILAKFFAVRSK